MLLTCPACKQLADLDIVESRPTYSGDAIRRRRECPACKTRFTTYETCPHPAPVASQAKTPPREQILKREIGMHLDRLNPKQLKRLKRAIVNWMERNNIDANSQPHTETTSDRHLPAGD